MSDYTFVIPPEFPKTSDTKYLKFFKERYLEWRLAQSFSYYGSEVPAGTIMSRGANHEETVDNSFFSRLEIRESVNQKELDEIKKIIDVSTDQNNIQTYIDRSIEQCNYRDHDAYAQIKGITSFEVEYIFPTLKGEEIIVKQPYDALITPTYYFWNGERGPGLEMCTLVPTSREHLKTTYEEVTGKPFPKKVPQHISKWYGEE